MDEMIWLHPLIRPHFSTHSYEHWLFLLLASQTIIYYSLTGYMNAIRVSHLIDSFSNVGSDYNEADSTI